MSYSDNETLAIGATAAPALGAVAVSALGVDSALTDLSDRVFEGDRTKAATWVGGALVVAGAALVGAAGFTDRGPESGPAPVAIGVALITMGTLIFLERGEAGNGGSA